MKGLWLFNNTVSSGLPELSKYRLNFMEVVHAVLSVLVFVMVGLRDKNVVSCFYPTPRREVQEVLDIVPIGIRLLCSLLFVAFPTRRHGIGYPVMRDGRTRSKTWGGARAGRGVRGLGGAMRLGGCGD
ncbi:hypothetical protein BUALT_Bualt15G0088700 [Buddleja alternifolia]|uniref:Uncharacterized protein n=1 Tax=Buddleja alternifolia TaxID=168488 RepID=A0AAV6WEA6_9LAMI|nr:hypothetical protein BUALT_Bualt15G0088700 [Buddleja alternifolia]